MKREFYREVKVVHKTVNSHVSKIIIASYDSSLHFFTITAILDIFSIHIYQPIYQPFYIKNIF